MTFGGGGSGGSLLRGNFCRWEGGMSKLLAGGGEVGGLLQWGKLKFNFKVI